MPYDIREMMGEYCVFNQDTDEKMKCYPTKEEADKYMAALDANVPDASKSLSEKGWVTINGAHILVGEDGGAGGRSGASGWKSPRDEFKFVQRRLGAGKLKKGEKRMLERRSERLAKDVLGVSKSIKGMMGEMDTATTCQECSGQCMDCIRMMESCQNRNAMHDACIQKCKECVATCQMTASDLMGDTSTAHCQDTCRQCSEACMNCVESLEQVAQACTLCQSQCESCSESCARCAEICQMNAGDMSMTGDQPSNSSVPNDTKPTTVKSIDAPNALKALSKTDDELIVGNYMVLFGGRDLTGIGTKADTSAWNSPPLKAKNRDGSIGEYFTKATVFESPYTFKGALDVDWEHGHEELDADEVIGYADWRSKSIDEKGIFVKRVLNRRNRYVQWLEPLIEAGLVGTSSRAIEKSIAVNPDGEITRWQLERDTLTVTPFEPRMLAENAVAALKALHIKLSDVDPEPKSEPVRADAEGATTPKADASVVTTEGTANVKANQDSSEVNNMSEEMKTMLAEGLTPLNDAVKSIGEKVNKLEDILKKEPASVAAGVHVEPGQKYPYKAFVKDSRGKIVDATGYGEFLQDVVEASQGNRSVSPRLAQTIEHQNKAIKATGLNVAIPSQGGFFVQTDHSAELIRNMFDVGTVLGQVRRIPLGPNADSVTLNGVDETSRATTIWGGILAYWVAEAVAPTPTKPKFRQIKLEVKGLSALYYATDKLLRTATALGAVVADGFREAMTLRVEKAIFDGDGAGKPIGLLSATLLATGGSTVSVAKESGQDADTVIFENTSKMWAQLLGGAKKNANWYINTDVNPQLDSLALIAGTAAIPPRYVDFGADGVMRMRGRPVIESEHCKTVGDQGDIILWDPTSYLFTDLGAVEEASSIHVAFTTAETVFRYLYYCDGQPMLAQALTPENGTNKLSTQVVLDARA